MLTPRRRARCSTRSTPTRCIGLRDRALIGLMVYTFARIGAVLGCGSRTILPRAGAAGCACTKRAASSTRCPATTSWKLPAMTTSPRAGIAGDPKGSLFRTAGARPAELTATPLTQHDAYRMIRRRAAAAGIRTEIGNHTFRATGITAYLKNGGPLENAQHDGQPRERPHHRSSTIGGGRDVSLDEVERIVI